MKNWLKLMESIGKENKEKHRWIIEEESIELRSGWINFLKPNLVKIVVTILLPSGVSLLVTQRPESVMDFYWYLLTPLVTYYDGVKITRIFNGYVLLWIPFYFAACIVVFLFSAVRPQFSGVNRAG